ncbi:MAG: NAD-dependent deacylase [Rhodocyclales bacterium GT-UBC]|nr:MAG: NAD-dependent deacylase [Rhodocyclales bacterium GT-UBC]
MKPEVQPNKLVVFSGAGVSAESGLPTFRDANGLWNAASWERMSSPQGWKKDPKAVLDFYNARRIEAWQAKPNAAHLAIASLEAAFEVVVITQNVDELHERAGSSKVVHVHGQIAYARGTSHTRKRYRVDDAPITLGQLCEDGSQLRPDVVWFGEDVEFLEEAKSHIASAGKVLVVGTSLSVFPVASLVKAARGRAEKVLVSLDVSRPPYGYSFVRSKATEAVPALAARWLAEARQNSNELRLPAEP